MKNKEETKEYLKQWRLANKSKIQEYQKQHHKQYNDSFGSGVYVACLGERILYVGQSKRLRRRICVHKSTYTNINQSNLQLSECIKQYNNKVEFVILENCDSNKLLEREQYYINLLQPEFN